MAAAGWTELGKYGPIYSVVYFRILMLVFRLLATGRHADPLRACVASRMGKPTPNVPRIKFTELLNTRCRHELICLAMHLIEEWPTRFVEACKGVGVTKTHLIKGDRDYPFAFAHAVEWALSEWVRVVTEDEVRVGMEYLRANNGLPTYRALTNLFGVKPMTHRSDRAAGRTRSAIWTGQILETGWCVERSETLSARRRHLFRRERGSMGRESAPRIP